MDGDLLWQRQDRSLCRGALRRQRSAVRRSVPREARTGGAAWGREPGAGVVEAAVFPAAPGPGGPVAAGPDVSRRRDSLRELWVEPGGAPLQPERGVARRQGGGGLHQQRSGGLPGGHLRARLRARNRGGHLAQPVPDRHLHRQLALRPGRPLQDAEAVHRPAGERRQPERHPAAELSAEIRRHAGPQGDGHPFRDYGVDGGERRRHPRHSRVEDLRRRPQRGGHCQGYQRLQAAPAHPGHIAGGDANRWRARQRRQAVHGAGCPIHLERQDAVRVR